MLDWDLRPKETGKEGGVERDGINKGGIRKREKKGARRIWKFG